MIATAAVPELWGFSSLRTRMTLLGLVLQSTGTCSPIQPPGPSHITVVCIQLSSQCPSPCALIYDVPMMDHFSRHSLVHADGLETAAVGFPWKTCASTNSDSYAWSETRKVDDPPVALFSVLITEVRCCRMMAASVRIRFGTGCVLRGPLNSRLSSRRDVYHILETAMHCSSPPTVPMCHKARRAHQGRMRSRILWVHQVNARIVATLRNSNAFFLLLLCPGTGHRTFMTAPRIYTYMSGLQEPAAHSYDLGCSP